VKIVFQIKLSTTDTTTRFGNRVM